MKRLAIALALLSTSALAQQQQQADPATMQKALQVLQQQRNTAMDAAASAEIRAVALSEEVTKLKAEIETLKKPKEEKK